MAETWATPLPHGVHQENCLDPLDYSEGGIAWGRQRMDQKVPQLSRAAIIGGSIAGLLTARVLSDMTEQVWVIDRDHLPQTNTPRKGVPQSVQPHVLFTKGYRILESLFPGIGEDLKAAGAVPIDWGREFHYCHESGWNAIYEGDSGLISFTCTRHLLETTIRRHVAKLPNVQWLEGRRVCGLEGNRQQVKGIRYRSMKEGRETSLTADIVIDASGRSSQAPKWLETMGVSIPKTIVNPHVGYATQRLQIPAGWQADWKVMLISQRPPHNPRLGYLAQVEGNEWIATLGGYGKDYPPLEQAGFLEFAHSLAHPAFYEAVKAAQPVTPIRAHRATANRFYHYEQIQMPHGFAAIGDAVCALCPVYGQGMTVSALSALILRDWLKQPVQAGKSLDTASFQKQLAKSLEFPWGMATGSDAQFPTTEGEVSSNAIATLFQKYVERLVQKSTEEGWIHVRFTEVAHMLKPPTAFFTPRLLLKVLATSYPAKRVFKQAK
ncbi:MAG: FAD-dependent monooxygenase [Cyanobacteria bacterium P01_F01_bin.86]